MTQGVGIAALFGRLRDAVWRRSGAVISGQMLRDRALTELLARPARRLGRLFAHRLGSAGYLAPRLLDQTFQLLQQRIGLPPALVDQVGEQLLGVATGNTAAFDGIVDDVLEALTTQRHTALEAFAELLDAVIEAVPPAATTGRFTRRFCFFRRRFFGARLGFGFFRCFFAGWFFRGHRVLPPSLCAGGGVDYRIPRPYPAGGRAKRAVTGAWSESRSARPSWSSSRRSGGHWAGGSTVSSPLTSRWSIARGAVVPARPKRSRSCSKSAGSRAGRRLKSPAKSSGAPCVPSLAIRAASNTSSTASAGWWAEACRLATQMPWPGRVKAIARGSGLPSWIAISPRAGFPRRAPSGRTRVRFEPPSPEAIRSGLRRAARVRSGPNELREVSTRCASAGQARASDAAKRGGHSCSSATSHSAAASTVANSSSKSRLTWTWVAFRSSTRSSRERQVKSAGSGGKSRRWKRFQATAVNSTAVVSAA